MKDSSFLFGFVVAITFVTSTMVAGEQTSKPKETTDQKTLREAEQELDKLFLMDDDSLTARLKRAMFEPQPMLDKAKSKKFSKDLRPRAAALVARIHRIALKNPTEGLSFITPFLIGKDKSEAWEKTLATNCKEVSKRWKEDKGKQADKPEKRDVFAPLPPVTDWDLTGENFRCAVEAANIFLSLNRRQDALSVFKHLGGKYKDNMAAILADEGGGDLHCQPGQYQKAVDFFKHAIKTANHIAKYLNDDPFGEAKHAALRIQEKLNNASHLADIENFGEGFCDYRRCEVLRRSRHLPFEAFLAFAKLRNKYPKTIWESVSVAYQIKCLLSLTDPKHVENAKKSIAQAEKAFDKDEKELAKAERSKALKKDKALRKLFRDELERRREELVKMRAVPLNDDALVAADKNAANFVKSELFGLYRCEVMLDMACYRLEKSLDLKATEIWLGKASDWLEKVEKADLDLAAYMVPDKAREVAATPKEEKSFGAWGNAKTNDVRIGAVVNRKSCRWYLPKLLRETRLRRGFTSFINGNLENAKRDFIVIKSLDTTVKDLHRRNWPNAYKRLMEDCDRGYFWGWPEDLKPFKGKKRTAVFLAGFYFEINEHAKAEALYDKLLANGLGKLKNEERAFVLQGKGECRYSAGDMKEAKACFEQVARKFTGTPTVPKALLSLANVCRQLPKEKSKAMLYFKELHKRFPKTKWGEKGLYYTAFVQAAERKAEGEKALHEFLSAYPKSVYAQAAERLLTQYKKN